MPVWRKATPTELALMRENDRGLNFCPRVFVPHVEEYGRAYLAEQDSSGDWSIRYLSDFGGHFRYYAVFVLVDGAECDKMLRQATFCPNLVPREDLDQLLAQDPKGVQWYIQATRESGEPLDPDKIRSILYGDTPDDNPA